MSEVIYTSLKYQLQAGVIKKEWFLFRIKDNVRIIFKPNIEIPR